MESLAGLRVMNWHLDGGPIALNGFDPLYFTDPRFGRSPLVGRQLPDVWDAVARGEAVIASSNFLMNLHRAVGDLVTIESPSGPVSLRIVGAITHFSSPRGTLILSRALFKGLWHDHKVTRFYIRATPGTDLGGLRRAIVNAFGRVYALNVISTAELIDYLSSQVRRGFAGIYILAGLVLFIVLVGLTDTLAAGVVERTRELGAIRVVGVRRRHVRRIVVLEGVVLSTLGLLLALAFGLLLGMLWVEATVPYLFGWALQLHFPYGHALRTLAVTEVACVLAALVPARQAAALEPAVALRYE